MKRFSTRLAGTLAALMISAPLALAATPSFAADYHDNDRHDRHDNDRNNYRGDNDRDGGYRDRDDHSNYDRDRYHRPAPRFERIVYMRGFVWHGGHWDWQHGHWMWTAGGSFRH